MSTHIAIDIGGSHGRGILGVYEGNQLTTAALGSFSTEPVQTKGRLCWNIEAITAGIRSILTMAASRVPSIDSIAVDTMGVAFVLLDRDRELICPPPYTRVPQDNALKEEILRHIGPDELYSITGLEQKKLNTLYYLTRLKREHPEYIKRTAYFLMLPDYINYILTGIIKSEYTISTTSNLFDIQKGAWSSRLLKYTGLPENAAGEIVPCCRPLGKLRSRYILHPALSDTMVVNAPSHDTASACFSLTSMGQDQAFISSGTWGMTGCIMDHPILTADARKSGFANEGAALGKIKFLNNAPNMSILEECMKTWRQEGRHWNWAALCEAASGESSLRSYISLEDPAFLTQENMPLQIQDYCRRTGQAVPEGEGAITRAVLESIALNYQSALKEAARLTGRTFRSAFMLGGASRNTLLVNLIQDALEIPVVKSRCEAAAAGNLLSQLLAMEVKEDVGGLDSIVLS